MDPVGFEVQFLLPFACDLQKVISAKGCRFYVHFLPSVRISCVLTRLLTSCTSWFLRRFEQEFVEASSGLIGTARDRS